MRNTLRDEARALDVEVGLSLKNLITLSLNSRLVSHVANSQFPVRPTRTEKKIFRTEWSLNVAKCEFEIKRGASFATCDDKAKFFSYFLCRQT